MAKSKYDCVAKQYEKTRPDYPEELITTLVDVTGINNDKSHLLEVGAGTGKATMPLAKLKYKIDCIEIEPNMAEILKEKCSSFPKVHIIIDNFETWESTTPKKYDLIYSAQAFHWIDEEIKYTKCNELLTENGKMALFWYFSVIESGQCFYKLNSIFQKYNTGFSCTGIEDCHNFFNIEKEKLESRKEFKNIKEYIYEGETMEQDAKLFIQRFNTTSAFASLGEKEKELINKELYEAIEMSGGIVLSKLVYMLYIAEPNWRKDYETWH